MTRAIITRAEGDVIISAGGPYVITAQGIELISTLSHAAQMSADAAQQSAANAGASAGEAAGSASAASGSATSAANSATAASNAKTAAETAATNAATSATAAGNAETAAADSASAAAGSASSASGSATAANAAKDAAETAASNAGASASAAAGSATSAGNSASAASGSATAAAGSASAASGSATAANTAKGAAETALNALRNELPNFSYAVSTLAPGENATLTGSGAYPDITLSFGVPRGEPAQNPNFTATATTVAPGGNATVTTTGAYPDLEFEFGIPRGADGSGAVSSVGLSVPTGLSVDNSPVTGIGTLTISYQTGYQGYTTAEASKLSGIAAAATKNQTDAYLLNRANHSGAQAISTITGLSDALGSKADLIGGLIPVGQLPAIAITDSFVVNSQAAMLALAVQVGDIAVRTDLSKTFVLKTEPATALANWVELLSPTAGVSSVSASGANGLTLDVANPSTTPAITLGGTLSIAGGGTGATNAGGARIALGAIGVSSSNLLTGGVRVTPVTLTPSAGAIQPDLSSRNMFAFTNQAAFTLYAPIDNNAHTAIIHVENASGAGAVTPSGFDYVDPDGLALFKTTVGLKFIFQIISGGAGKKCLYIMKASA